MKVKCRFCDVKDTDKENMVLEEHVTSGGNVQRKYYHNKCYNKHLEKQEFINKEQAELDKLVETIMEIHQIQSIPHQFYPIMQDLRNGTLIVGRNKKKRYKQGYPYPLIEKTYLFCRESIEYWKKNKEFTGILNELMYCWTIINDKITVVKKREEKKSFQKAKKEAEVQQDKDNGNIVSSDNVEFKKRKREDDISDFL